MQKASTTPRHRSPARALGWATVASLIALLMLGSAGASVLAVVGTSLNQTPPITSDAINFQGDEEECAGTPAGSVVWHFVLTKTAASSATLTATFAGAGMDTYPSAFKTGQTLHWFVTTSSPDTLLSATTDAVGNNLNLSHICDGGGETTTSTQTTSTNTTSSP